jgi:hypothetical protein
VALAARDHAVLKAVFGRLTDGDLLKKVAAGAADPGMRLAAALKTGSQNLDDLVNEAKALDKEASRLARTEVDADKATAIASNIVAAISLSGEVQNSVIETMQWACKRTIWQRDDSRIQEIVELLALYDDKELARNCSDCRQPDWEDAGYGWYKAHVIQATPRKGGLPATVAADQENGRH